MPIQTYFYFIDKTIETFQGDIVFIKERNHNDIILWCDHLGIFWRSIENGKLTQPFEIKRPSFRAATLIEIANSHMLQYVYGAVQISHRGVYSMDFRDE